MAAAPVVLLMGPTAAGKSAVAAALAEGLPCEIVSVDSALVYRGMDIGTAKPDDATRARVAHHLIDICDPAEAYSAGRFVADARAAIDAIAARGRVPLLTGGTMLYVRALTEGLAELPPASPRVRAELDAAAAKHGWAALHAELARVDPDSAARLHRNDAQRIQRALEIHRICGQPLSALRERAGARALARPAVRLIVAPASRARLHARIAERFHDMLAAGFVAEVAALRARGDLRPGMPSMRAVGYRQVWGYLEGRYDYRELGERGVAATRQLARRQLGWLRREPQAVWLDSDDARLPRLAREHVVPMLE